MKHLGDITKIHGWDIEPVDCITGGSPCQDLSVAGKRAGLSGERSGLFMEQIRIVKEMKEHDRQSGRPNELLRPRFMVWENVPGAFSSNKGADFQAVLTEIVRIVEPKSPDVPMPEGGRWTHSGCLYDEMGRWSIAWRLHDAQFWGVPQRRKRIALVADFGGLSAPEVLFERKGLSRHPQSSSEARKGTAEGAGDGTATTGHVYDARGNGTGYVSPSLTGDHQNRVTDYTGICVGGNDIAQTLDASYHKGPGNRNGKEREVVAVVFDKEMYNYGNGFTGTPQAKETEVGPTVRADSHPSGVCYNRIVRRLTPLECERLQGYSDGWTDIGEWTDSKGKRHKAADSPRYKALGNSIALPFWFWLLRRISAQYERPATLGSLFDGIGGFPLCWERCNGKGTARWASEIEEFPIAVTKLRFPEEDDR